MGDRITVKVDPDLEDLIPGFIENRNADVTRLRELLATEAYADIRLIGHSLKGVGGGYGFDAITEYGGVIEQAALAGDNTTIAQYTDQLAHYLEHIDIVFEE